MYIICKHCSRVMVHHAKGLCIPCYHTLHPRRVDFCMDLGHEGPQPTQIWAKNRCEKCYRRYRYRQTIKTSATELIKPLV